MTVQDLYRVISDKEKVAIETKNCICLWYGENEDMPSEYFEKIVNAIYSFKRKSCIIIEIA